MSIVVCEYPVTHRAQGGSHHHARNSPPPADRLVHCRGVPRRGGSPGRRDSGPACGLPGGDLTRAPDTDPPSDPIVRRSSGTARGYLLSKGRYTPVDAPKAGPETVPTGLNNRGQVVGAYVDAAGRTHGFLLARGRYRTVDAPTGTYTVITDINDHGSMVGVSSDSSGTCHGFRLDASRFTRIELPGAVGTQPWGINNSGQISGSYSDTASQVHGFVQAKSAGRRPGCPSTRTTSATASCGGVASTPRSKSPAR